MVLRLMIRWKLSARIMIVFHNLGRVLGESTRIFFWD